jgi:NAD(P)-dependent dehydrogenase (short-subunit alcohol dehydrogenase family)
MQDGSFAGKVAFVTGAASGIGHAAALAFARTGASVVVTDLAEEANQQPVHDDQLPSLASRRRRRGSRHVWLGSGRPRGGSQEGIPGWRAINTVARISSTAPTLMST